MDDQCFHTFTDDEGHPHDCTLTIGHKEQHYCEHDNRLPAFVVPRAAPPASEYRRGMEEAAGMLEETAWRVFLVTPEDAERCAEHFAKAIRARAAATERKEGA